MRLRLHHSGSGEVPGTEVYVESEGPERLWVAVTASRKEILRLGSVQVVISPRYLFIVVREGTGELGRFIQRIDHDGERLPDDVVCWAVERHLDEISTPARG